jgi:type VI secretion system secreted protein VgrG
MAEYKQTNRSLQVTTPLGDNVLLITGFRGIEQISYLFSIEVSLIAENSTPVDFSKLVGQDITLSVATAAKGGDADWRCISGICASFSQGNRNEEFTSYYAEIVPKVWLLTRRARCRIFQQKSVPDTLKEVLKGFDTDFQLSGRYEPREYCVQYRETDFDFASRLMEEEGIFYFFEHRKSGHKMIVADSPAAHADVPGLTQARYDVIEGGGPTGDHIFDWRKTQALRSAKYSLRDHCFQQPTKDLEAKASIMESVKAGTVSHQLNGQSGPPLEIYDFPGGYAVRFDGINPSGGEQPERLQKILDDNKRTAKLRMEAEALPSLSIHGSSGCRNFVAGHKFTLARHFDGDGDYILLSVTHEASIGSAYRTGSTGGDMTYANTFTCIPSQLPFRPARKTAKPFIQGVQNALVTGPPGEEIFTDKYGRVKVQFYWDREGKKDANSSCWLRVATPWAGKGWGSINIPRIGHEVIVAFVEGNPDEPVIVGNVYNRETMPTNALPDKKVVCGLRSNTHKGKGYNEMSMDDTAGKEKITIHAQYDMGTTVGHDLTNKVLNDEKTDVTGNRTETVQKKETITIVGGREEVVSAGEKITISGGRTESVTGGETITITGAQNITVNGSRTEEVTSGEQVTIKGDTTHKVTGDLTIHATGELGQLGDNNVTINGPDITVQAKKDCNIIGGSKLTLAGPGGTIVIDAAGVTIQGLVVNIN